MKKVIILTAFTLLLAASSFAQRANNWWSNENVQTISGTVYDNARPTSYMKTDDGTYYKVHLGPIWFWNQNNYTFQTGSVKITGNVKTQNNELQIFPFTIEQKGSVITLADEKGAPKWGNNRGGRGKGNNNSLNNSNGNGRGRGNCWGNGNGNGWGRGNCPCRNK
ncbi:MAG: hypothetical protein NTV87_10005 [Ignavibacteriae bacterium]|nr:hypothetical protein [Ignavibacteriota bacterium]